MICRACTRVIFVDIALCLLLDKTESTILQNFCGSTHDAGNGDHGEHGTRVPGIRATVGNSVRRPRCTRSAAEMDQERKPKLKRELMSKSNRPCPPFFNAAPIYASSGFSISDSCRTTTTIPESVTWNRRLSASVS